MNKKDIEKINDRIAHLKREMEANMVKIRTLQILNKSLDGGIIELSSMLVDLAPKKEEKK